MESKRERERAIYYKLLAQAIMEAENFHNLLYANRKVGEIV